jgi:uncharacterized heparinase superfamily protein
VVHLDGWSARRARFLNRLAARSTARSQLATGFVSQPEPRTIGLHARGKQLIAGNFLLAGYFVEAPGQSPWDVPSPHPEFLQELHGFGWLDHLAAVGDRSARHAAQGWTQSWISRYDDGSGPGWTPDLTGRRLIRWINHALFLMAGQKPEASRALFKALAHQTAFLAKRWDAAQPGLPRFEALTGLLYAGVALTGMEHHVARAKTALAGECIAQIDADGGIPTRNPEELLEVFTLLTWAAAALSDAGQMTETAHVEAIERIAVTLRTLRHVDGGLARFHGGGRGMEGRLDHALAASGVRSGAKDGRAMGFARLQGGRTSVIVDAAPPPMGPASAKAHASTLAFELTSNRRALIVTCGAGLPFGEDWECACRATASHSTLSLDGFSSARMGSRSDARPLLVDGPRSVGFDRTRERYATALLLSHGGYVASHGLTHVRQLDLSVDGRVLSGEDSLVALSAAEQKRFASVRARNRLGGIRFAIRFHLHPDCDASIDMGGKAASVALRSGEIWVLRHNSNARLTLEPSVYLEKGRLKPRPAQQIVLSGVVKDYTSQISWSLAKAQDTPIAIRDIGRDDPLALPDL